MNDESLTLDSQACWAQQGAPALSAQPHLHGQHPGFVQGLPDCFYSSPLKGTASLNSQRL